MFKNNKNILKRIILVCIITIINKPKETELNNIVIQEEVIQNIEKNNITKLKKNGKKNNTTEIKHKILEEKIGERYAQTLFEIISSINNNLQMDTAILGTALQQIIQYPDRTEYEILKEFNKSGKNIDIQRIFTNNESLSVLEMASVLNTIASEGKHSPIHRKVLLSYKGKNMLNNQKRNQVISKNSANIFMQILEKTPRGIPYITFKIPQTITYAIGKDYIMILESEDDQTEKENIIDRELKAPKIKTPDQKHTSLKAISTKIYQYNRPNKTPRLINHESAPTVLLLEPNTPHVFSSPYRVQWYINNKAQDEAHQIEWLPSPGRHTLMAVAGEEYQRHDFMVVWNLRNDRNALSASSPVVSQSNI